MNQKIKKTIVLITDHPDRDLKGIVLLAAELTLMGHKCIISPLNLCNHEVWKYYPDLVHLPYLRPNNESYADKLHRANILYTVLDTEGGVLEDFSIIETLLPRNPKITMNCSRFFCWGKPLEEYLVNNKIFFAEKISTTGQPRIDYYHKSFQASLQDKRIKPPGRYFLFNSVFSFSNPRYSTKEAELANAVKMYNADFETFKLLQERWSISLKKFIELTKKAAALFPKHTIIYRPHPFESDEIYKIEFKDIDNIIVTNDGQVDSWIAQSEAVIQLKCSTAFESRMLNKPVLLPIWIGDLEGDTRINMISHIINDEEDFFNILGKITQGGYKLPESILNIQAKIIEDIYFTQDGSAYKRVSSEINHIVNNKTTITSKKSCENFKSKFSISSSENWKSKYVKLFLKYSLISSFLIKSQILEFLAIRKWKKTSKYFNIQTLNTIIENLKISHPEFQDLEIIKPNGVKGITNSYQIQTNKKY